MQLETFQRPESRTTGGRDWWRLALLAWTSIVLVIGIRGVFWPKSHSTFFYYANAGHNWLEGIDLYQLQTATCRYSPLITACCVPFSVVPEEVGAQLWRLVNVGAFLGGLYWWSRRVLPGISSNQRGLLFLATIPLAIGPVHNAQSNPLLIGLLLLGLAAAAAERWNLAAAFIVLSILIKVYPVSVALLLVLLFPRQFTGRFLVALAVGLLLPFGLQSPDYVARQYQNWFRNLEVDTRFNWLLEVSYRDLWLLVRVLHIPLSVTGYQVIQAAVAGLVALLCWIQARRGCDRLVLLNSALGLACCWMMLFGPATESSTYIVLAPTMAWALLDAWYLPRPGWIKGLVATAFGMFVLARLASLFPFAANVHALGPHPLGALLLFLALIRNTLADAAQPTTVRGPGKPITRERVEAA
jgi:hypothetical protein